RVYHHAISAIALRSWLGDVISIGAHAVTNDLPQNPGSAASCTLQFFQDEYTCSLADDEAVSARIPRAAGLLRFIMARGKCSHRREPADTHRRDGSLGAASNHHLGITARDDLISVAHRVRARGTSGASSLVWSLGAITNADMSGRKVHDCRRNKEGRNSARAPVQQIAVLAFDHIETTDTGSDVHPDTSGKFGREFQPRHLHRLICRGQGEVDEAAHLLEFFLVDELQRVETLDLGRDLAGKIGRIKLRNPRHSAFAGEQVLPRLVRGVPDCTDQAQTGDYDPSTQLLPAFRVLPDIVDRVLHSANFFRILIANLDLESLFKSHHQLDGVERAGAQAVHERSVGCHLALIHSQLLHDDLFHLIV